MCTAMAYRTGSGYYFGRTLDLECSYGEQVVVMPRRFPLDYRLQRRCEEHFAMVGVAAVRGGYPLYYEAVNEHGLAMAGLNFPGYAHYCSVGDEDGRDRIAPFELIPWILSQCRDVGEARERLLRLRLCRLDFDAALPLTPLHWMLSDGSRSIVYEPMATGARVLDNPVEVLTNAPDFGYHMTHLCDYAGLRAEEPGEGTVGAALQPDSRGMGALGLPGDFSSASRFIRAAFVKANAVVGSDGADAVGQFFHMMDTVAVPRGCVRLRGGEMPLTVYTSCYDLLQGVCYYTTYENRSIRAVELRRCAPDGVRLSVYSMVGGETVTVQN